MIHALLIQHVFRVCAVHRQRLRKRILILLLLCCTYTIYIVLWDGHVGPKLAPWAPRMLCKMVKPGERLHKEDACGRSLRRREMVPRMRCSCDWLNEVYVTMCGAAVYDKDCVATQQGYSSKFKLSTQHPVHRYKCDVIRKGTHIGVPR